MNIIKLKVNNFEIIPEEKSYVIENQVNEFALEFEFDDSWNYETKYVIFDNEESTYKRPIINNQVIIPSELLNGKTTIQIYAQDVENNEIVKRKPSFKYSFSILNSLFPEGVEENDLPTPSQWEIYISQIEEMCNNLQDQFDDLKEECETKCDDVIERLAQDEQDIQTNTDNIRTNAENIDKLNTDLLDYSLITETGNKLSMSINPQTYVITLSLKDKNDNILSTQSVDLPLETMIVSASYSNGILTFTLKNGQTLQVPISDLIDGLVSTDTFNEAVQGLSNRITSIENDYLKASDKTELQNQITQNADDISDIKGEQLTQNADIESLQQENERLSRIVSGLPTKNASGTNIVLNDMVNCEIKEISLKGDTLQDGTPTPDTPVEIQSVKGNQTIQFCGKNLMFYNAAQFTTNENTWYFLNGQKGAYGSNIGTKTNIKTPVESGKTYTISCDVNIQIDSIQLVYSDEVIIDTDTGEIGKHTITFTSTKNTDIIIRVRPKNNQNVDISNIQIEEGNATPYEQYSGTTFPISLGTIELNKIGDYQDKIYKSNDKWYLEKNVGKYVYNNDLRSNGIDANKVGLITPELNVKGDIPTNDFGDMSLCNILPTTQQNYTGLSGTTRLKRIRLYFNLSYATTYEEALELCSDLIIYYGYETPVITEITDDNLINQLEALNNYILLTNNTIISNCNLPVINDITGYVDIMSLLSTQNNRNVIEEKKIVTKPVEEPIDEPVEEPVETKEEER
jgi:hypothetical protein